MADTTTFTFQISRQFAEALGPVEMAKLVGQDMTVRWDGQEKRARVAAVQMGDSSVSVTMVIQGRLSMGAEPGSFSVPEATEE